MSERALTGRNVLITGANRNLGRAAALAFADAGANVVVHAHRNADEANVVAERVAALGVEAMVVMGDISVPEEVSRMVDGATKRLGPINILVNNAAIRPKRSFFELTVEEIYRVFAVNLFSAYYLAMQTIPAMIDCRWGRVINVSGVDGLTGAPMEAHIAATKAGLIGFTKSLALELAPRGITVNCIAPGPFRTQRTPEWFPGWDSPEAWDREYIKLMPVGRFGEPEEFGCACVFLALPTSAFITGHTLHINGGYYMA